MRYLFLLLPFLMGCRHLPRPDSHAFYYWKLADYEAVDTQLVHKLDVHYFYVHFFDVDWSESLSMPVPLNRQHAYWREPYCPVIFITNRTFERLADSSCEWLAGKITTKLYKAAENAAPPFKEVQIDCDWTPATRDKYFHFLRAFKRLNDKIDLSATIRLYPYKYFGKMGVPPVDRGMLMCYNMDRIKETSTANSVFDEKVLTSYLNGTEYPLPMDVAFPIFGWHVWFRGKEFKGIVHEEEDPIPFTSIPADTVIGGHYFREGDVLRPEFPDSAKLASAIHLVMQKVPKYRHIAFYHWNPSSIASYEKVIQETFASY